MRVPKLAVVLTLMSLILSSCTLPNVVDPSTWRGRVGQGEVRAQAGSATVVFPDGVAPAGTGATVKAKVSSGEAPTGTAFVSETLEVTLDGGVQPSAPVTITLPVKAEGTDAATLAERYLLFVSSVGADGNESMVPGTFDAATRTFTFSVEHFSDFKVLGVDIGAKLDEVRTAIMQGLGLEFPAPDCVGKPVTINGTKYEVVSPAGAHLCVGEEKGSLVVSAEPAVAMPYLMTSVPRVDGTTAATEVTLTTSGLIAFAKALGFIGKSSKTGVFPGAKASYTFKGTPQMVAFDLEQYPVLLLMVILAKTLDTLGIATIDKLDDLQCLSDVATTSSAFQDGVNGEAVGAFVRSFFSCAGTVADLNLVQRFILAALGTAPALLVTAVVGIINEFTGQARQHVDVTVTPLRMTDEQILNSELPANVCRAADGRGWDHSKPIRMKDGQGEAVAADGSYGGATVLESKVFGRRDLDGDGKQEILLLLWCAGSPREYCCAGRSSIMRTVAAFVQNGTGLRQVGRSLMGGATPPGDKFGPADRQIWSVTLRGSTVVTSETIIYPEQYTFAQAGGADPAAPVTVEYKLKNGSWVASRP